jgi:Tfp pilus assembly protein FimT
MKIKIDLALSKGMTVIELLTVVFITVTIAAIAIPNFIQWRESINYRSTARDLSNVLREARSRTISYNLQHRVELSSALSPTSFRLMIGNQAANTPSTGWTPATGMGNWTTLPAPVQITVADIGANPPNITFNPNGTANLVSSTTISVLDNTGVTRFAVTVANTGRISIGIQ